MKLYYLKNKAIWALLLLSFAFGIYTAAVRLNNLETFFVDELYFFAKEGQYIDLGDTEINAQVMLSIIYIIVVIPVIVGTFVKDYAKKCCYMATRRKNSSNYIINELFNMLICCFCSSLIYSLGILLDAAVKSDGSFNNVQFPFYMFLSVVSGAMILFIFSALGYIISLKLNEKIGILIVLAVVFALTMCLFFLKIEAKQFNIIGWYFFTELLLNKAVFPLPVYVYYIEMLSAGIFVSLASVVFSRKKEIL